MKNPYFTKNYTDRKTITTKNCVKYELDRIKRSQDTMRHVYDGWTDRRTDGQTFVYHNTSRQNLTGV